MDRSATSDWSWKKTLSTSTVNGCQLYSLSERGGEGEMEREEEGSHRNSIFFDGSTDDGEIENSEELESVESGSTANNSSLRLPQSTWPQSFRQSIDIFTSVTPPTVEFLRHGSLKRLGSSFWAPSEVGPIPEIPEPLHQPLISDQDDLLVRSPQEQHTLHHGTAASHQCSYMQSIVNGINVLCGVGVLSTPYAIKEGGWLGLLILLMFAFVSCYTGMLLKHCLDSRPGLQTYPDIGQAAFGTVGRLTVSIILYAELYACSVEYLILVGDNLSSLFPNAHMALGGYELSHGTLFASIATVCLLPTVWLRDLRILSYLSACGVIASIMVTLSLLWVGVVDGVGFHKGGTLLDLNNLPVALGLYGFCYSGHSVFPNIYSSMKERRKFPAVLLSCFSICTVIYAAVAVMGFSMFGESIQSQVTLTMPKQFVASNIAVWTTIVNPFTKYALTITPVALSLEELLPSDKIESRSYSIAIRTALAFSTLSVAVTLPFFGLLMALVGSLLTMLVALILPCACYLSILRGRVTRCQGFLCIVILALGVACAWLGTYSTVMKMVHKMG